jgi:hypothetical protein
MRQTMTKRIDDLTDRVRERRTTTKIQDLDRENHELRTEMRSLRAELDRQRSDRDELMDALKARRVTRVTKKRGGLVRTVVVGGGAYLLGAKAGRERYEQAMEWFHKMRNRGEDAMEDVRRGETTVLDESRPSTTPSSTVRPRASAPREGTAIGREDA